MNKDQILVFNPIVRLNNNKVLASMKSKIIRKEPELPDLPDEWDDEIIICPECPEGTEEPEDEEEEVEHD